MRTRLRTIVNALDSDSAKLCLLHPYIFHDGTQTHTWNARMFVSPIASDTKDKDKQLST